MLGGKNKETKALTVVWFCIDLIYPTVFTNNPDDS